MINMLPTKIRNHLSNKFGEMYFSFSKKQISEYLSEFEDNAELVNRFFNRHGILTKVVYNLFDKDPIIQLLSYDNVDYIIKMVRSDNNKNYHDFFTTFKINTKHTLYDLIVEVNYRYVYD